MRPREREREGEENYCLPRKYHELLIDFTELLPSSLSMPYRWGLTIFGTSCFILGLWGSSLAEIAENFLKSSYIPVKTHIHILTFFFHHIPSKEFCALLESESLCCWVMEWCTAQLLSASPTSQLGVIPASWREITPQRFSHF